MSEPPVLDTAVLDDLVEHIGADALRSIIEIFIAECRELSATIADACIPASRPVAIDSTYPSTPQIWPANKTRRWAFICNVSRNRAGELMYVLR